MSRSCNRRGGNTSHQRSRGRGRWTGLAVIPFFLELNKHPNAIANDNAPKTSIHHRSSRTSRLKPSEALRPARKRSHQIGFGFAGERRRCRACAELGPRSARTPGDRARTDGLCRADGDGDELLVGLAQHLAGGAVERGKQAQGAVALVVDVVALGAPGRQRQRPVVAIQGLDRRPWPPACRARGPQPRHQAGQPLRLKRPRPRRDERVVAAKLAAGIDPTVPLAAESNAARAARQRGTAVTLARHGIRFSARFERRRGSLHACVAGGNASAVGRVRGP